jgi:hypothetical protein
MRSPPLSVFSLPVLAVVPEGSTVAPDVGPSSKPQPAAATPRAKTRKHTKRRNVWNPLPSLRLDSFFEAPRCNIFLLVAALVRQ